MSPWFNDIVQWLHGMGLHLGSDAVQTLGQGAAQMDLTSMLALAAALGWASGLRLYAVVFLVGAMGAAGWITLPPGLELLQYPAVLVASGFMLLVEFFADKVPLVDSLWDAIHALIRIPAGGLLAAGAMGGDSAALTLAAGLLGGSLATAAFATKATTRAAINTSPEPFSNGVVSLFEDGLVVGVIWLAIQHPLLFAVVLVLLLGWSIFLLLLLHRFLKVVIHRLRRLSAGAPTDGTQVSPNL